MLTLEAQQRNIRIKPKNIRMKGKIPAVFYGRKEQSTPISIDQRAFLKVWKEAGESAVITLSVDGKNKTALIHDVAIDPVRGDPIHADFYITEADRAVEVSVPLSFIDEAPAVKEFNGVLSRVLHEVTVSGLPKDLPNDIEVSVSSLETLEDQILVKDLPLPAGITLVTSVDEVVAIISEAKEEEEEPQEFDAESVAVEKKGKEDDGSEEKKEETEPKE